MHCILRLRTSPEDIRNITIGHEQVTLHDRYEGGTLGSCHDVTEAKKRRASPKRSPMRFIS